MVGILQAGTACAHECCVTCFLARRIMYYLFCTMYYLFCTRGAWVAAEPADRSSSSASSGVCSLTTTALAPVRR